MHLVIVTFGSAGDVYPFIDIGMAMTARGHRVTVMTNEHFGDAIRRSGLEFHQMGTEEEFRQAVDNPDLWHPTKAMKVIVDVGIVPSLRPVIDAVRGFHEADPDGVVLLVQSLGFGGILAGEAFGIPTITAHLAPVVVRSDHRFPRMPGPNIPDWAPRFSRRIAWWIADKIIDRLMAKPINEVRAELGLPKASRFFGAFLQSDLRTLGLWPDWYCPRLPDWPDQFRAVGFPLADGGHLEPLPDGLEEFLAAGEPPVVFTPGTAMAHGHDFFRESVAACERLGVRGLLLTRHREHLPPSLPDGVRHFDFVPFRQVLPRSAALVYHGGIGTASQAFAAGIPHVVMPMAHDQFDNGWLIEKLGVGATVPVKRYRSRRLATVLARLLDSPSVAGHCADYAARLRTHDALATVCDSIEDAERMARASA